MTMHLPDKVRIFEVGPRDGLQNEAALLPLATRLAFITRLAQAGLRDIEVAAFVSPKVIPRMADSAELMAGLPTLDAPPRWWALTPNLRGLDRAERAGVKAIGLFVSATEAFSQANTNCSIAESLSRAAEVADKAKALGIAMRGYVSCVLACPWEGATPPAQVGAVAKELYALGVEEVSLGDTIGKGTPRAVQAMVEAVGKHVPPTRLAAHFHDTYGQGLANTLAAMDVGVAIVDASAAGLGGCPYAPGATGNLATEDLLYMLRGMDIETGVDFDRLAEAGRFAMDALGRKPASRVSRALMAG